MCLEDRYFGIDDMRSAVEYLKTIPEASAEKTFIGLVAEAATVETGLFKLGPTPMIKLRDILGKTPAEVWDMFDADIDRQCADLAERFERKAWNI